jgi:LmbE family N-acetylglucosaminyl deacetylase
MNVLILAPHPDDEAIGCGGSVAIHATKGDTVSAVFLTSGELGLKSLPRDEARATREQEARKSCALLGITHFEFFRGPDWMLSEALRELAPRLSDALKSNRPQLVYLPHPLDWHPDHQVCLPLLRAALLQSNIAVPELRGYEVWTPMTDYDAVEDISAVMPLKLRALRAHRSQLTEFDYVRAIKGLNCYRGQLAARCKYAEVFQSLSIA